MLLSALLSKNVSPTKKLQCNHMDAEGHRLFIRKKDGLYCKKCNRFICGYKTPYYVKKAGDSMMDVIKQEQEINNALRHGLSTTSTNLEQRLGKMANNYHHLQKAVVEKDK